MGVTDDAQTISCVYVDVKFNTEGFHIILERGKDIRLFTSETISIAIVNAALNRVVSAKHKCEHPRLIY